ncbi:unnamed protein product [Paramecium primaurelia]|uniref:Uncharacterized protein n=1 Tax=Paramecium primaurelia TaxID=5886 RepID=A0A8S1P4N8_PARPR|nr:unnamed protein product [Paramecium primaurelia]
MNEFQICQQLKYIMRILEQILSYAIQDVKDNRNEPDESIMLQQEIELIWKKLQNLQLTDKQFSFVNRFKQKLLALPNAQCMLKLIEQTEKQVQQLEILLLQKDNLIQYFQGLLNRLNYYYEQQIQELQIQIKELNLSLKTFLILQYELESAKELQLQYSQKLSIQCIKKQRLNILKFKLQLIAYKGCFYNILTIPSEEFQNQKMFSI